MKDHELINRLENLYTRLKQMKVSFKWAFIYSPFLFRMFLGLSWPFTIFIIIAIAFIYFILVKQLQSLSKAIGTQFDTMALNQNMQTYLRLRKIKEYMSMTTVIIIITWFAIDFPENLTQEWVFWGVVVGLTVGLIVGIVRYVRFNNDLKTVLIEINQRMKAMA